MSVQRDRAQPNESEEKTIDEIRRQIEGVERDATPEWLAILYESRCNRFLAENAKIWETGRIFITVSLALFAVYGALKPANSLEAVGLAALSVAFLFIWIIVAENHRRFQNHHEYWLNAIERALRIHAPKPRKSQWWPPSEWWPPAKWWPPSIYFMRWALFIIVTLAWAILIETRYRVVWKFLFPDLTLYFGHS
jgi:hypothetical protein